MSVHFIYRCHYEGPSEKYIRHFDDDDTVLGWFQRRWGTWPTDHAEASRRAEEILGTDVYGIGSLGQAIAGQGLPRPSTVAELGAILDTNLYVEGEILLDEHCLQVLTNDDELEMAFFLVDDLFLQQNAGLGAFLLHEDWRLPPSREGAAEGAFAPSVKGTPFPPEGAGDGRVWISLLAYYDSGNLSDLEGSRVISGIRLLDLPSWLLQGDPTDDWSWPLELRLLRSQLLVPPRGAESTEVDFLRSLARRPDERETWAVYGDWLLARGQPRAEVVVLRRALGRCRELPVARISNAISWKDRCRGDPRTARDDAAALAEEAGGPEPRGRELSRLFVDEHLGQLCLFTAEWQEGRPMFHQWIIFDDLWAAAHPALADGVLRFAARWDVLSDGDAD